MKKIIENVKFIQDGTLVFGDLHLENGFVERIDYKTPHANSYLAIPGFIYIPMAFVDMIVIISNPKT